MKDFNFFSEFTQKKSSNGAKTALWGLIILGAVAIVAGAYLLLVLVYNGTQGKISDIESFLASPSAQSVTSQAAIYKTDIADLQKYILIAGDAENNLAVSDRFNAGVMRALAAALPSQTRLSALSVEGSQIMLVVTVPNMDSAAQATAACEKFEYFSNVSVGGVTYEKTGAVYNLSLTAELKDGGVTE